MKKVILLLAFLLAQLLPAQGQVDSVLFIGNSYTYGNNLPLLFENLARSAGDTFFVQSITAGGYTLQSHLNNPTHINTIQQRAWDYFIVQDQSQVPTIDFYFNSLTLPAASSLDSYFKSSNDCAKVYYFMTWGRRFGGQQCDASNTHCSVAFNDFSHMQDTLKSRYLRVARQTDAAVSPVGEAWRLALQDTTGLVLHTSDNSHPNLYGSYLAACTHYASLRGQSPVGLSYTAGLNATWANYLQRKAHEAVLDSLTVYYMDTTGLPSFELSLGGMVNAVDINCQSDSLTVWTQLSYKGEYAEDSLSWSLNSYDAQGDLLDMRSFSLAIDVHCSLQFHAQTDLLPLNAALYCLTLESSYMGNTGLVVLVDTLAVFPANNLLNDSFYIEAFTARDYTSSQDFWMAEYDSMSAAGWSLGQDAAALLQQPTQGAAGAAIASVPSMVSPKLLITPCLTLRDSIDYEIRFKHANHRFDSLSQAAFRLRLDTTANFSQFLLLHDFGRRYDSLFTTFVDTFSVAQQGTYYLGIEIYHWNASTGTSLLGIDDFQIRALPAPNLPTPTIAEPSIPSNTSALLLYPNPTKNYFHLAHPALNGACKLRIYNLQGQERSHLVQRETGSRYRTLLPTGMYILVVEKEGLVLDRKRLLIVE